MLQSKMPVCHMNRVSRFFCLVWAIKIVIFWRFWKEIGKISYITSLKLSADAQYDE